MNSPVTLCTVVYSAEVILMDKIQMRIGSLCPRQIVGDRKTAEDARTTKRK